MSEREFQHELDDELLSAYLDDELTPEERAAVDARLAGDPDAQQLLHQLRSVSQSVQALPEIPVGRDLREEILRRVEANKAGAVAEREKPSPLGGALSAPSIFQSRRPWIWASLVLAAGLLIMVLQPGVENDKKLASVAQNNRGGETTREIDALRRAEKSKDAVAAPADSSTIASNGDAALEPMLAGKPAPPETPLTDKSDADKLATAELNARAAQASAPAPAAPATSAFGFDDESLIDRSKPNNSPSAPPQRELADGLGAGQPSPAAVSSAAPKKSDTFGPAGFGGGGGAKAGSTKKLSQTDVPTAAPEAPSSPAGGITSFGGQLQKSVEDQDSLVVVHVVATPDALERRSFDDLLKAKGIAMDSEITYGPEDAGRADGTALRTGSSSAASLPPVKEQLAAQKDKASDQHVEMVLVEAPESQIVSCLTDLKNDNQNYLGVEVEPTNFAQDRAELNGAVAEQKRTDSKLRAFNRGVVSETQKDQYRRRYYFRDDVATSPQQQRAAGARVEEVKQQPIGSVAGIGSGRARRLSTPEFQAAQDEKPMRLKTEPEASTVRRSQLRRVQPQSPSPAKAADGNLQVLFVLGGPEQTAAPGAPAAKPAE